MEKPTLLPLSRISRVMNPATGTSIPEVTFSIRVVFPQPGEPVIRMFFFMGGIL
jgi:hypothetical protein